MKIGIIGAMAVEVAALKEKMQGAVTTQIAGMYFYEGELFGKEAVVVQCGIGKVAAAACAQAMILRFDVTHIINTGVGGTLTEKLNILDVAISEGVVEHDMDTSPLGDPVGLISGINLVTVPTSRRLADAAILAANRLGIHSERGIIASGDQFIASREKKQFIVEHFGAICCEMEGAAIGHVCYINSVECVVVRAISDSATGEAELEYPEMCARAAERSQKMIEEIFAQDI